MNDLVDKVGSLLQSTQLTSQKPVMSASAKSMLDKVRKLVPPMLEKFHKGQLGRVAVVGGSKDYTGAPYFSAMASARLGCDLSYVFLRTVRRADDQILLSQPDGFASPPIYRLRSLRL